MGNLTLSRPVVRAAFCAFLALLPLGTAWNLFVARNNPKLALQIGPKLGGVVYDNKVALSWASLGDGSFQKAAASHIADAIPIRPLLIRMNNQLRFGLFGEMTAPDIVQGARGQLIERVYLDDYCKRTEGMGKTLAAEVLPKLRDVQDYYDKRGDIFVYIVTPSKAAHLPEYFVDRVPCPSTPAASAKMGSASGQSATRSNIAGC